MKIQNIKTGIFQQRISYLNKILQVKKNKQSFSNIWELTDCRLYLLSAMAHAAEEPVRDLAFGPEFLYISFFVTLFIKYVASFKDRGKCICRPCNRLVCTIPFGKEVLSWLAFGHSLIPQERIIVPLARKCQALGNKWSLPVFKEAI